MSTLSPCWLAQLVLLTDGVGAPVQVVALDRPYGVDETAVLALVSLVLFTDDVEAAVDRRLAMRAAMREPQGGRAGFLTTPPTTARAPASLARTAPPWACAGRRRRGTS